MSKGRSRRRERRETWNRYTYVGNSSLNATDSLGLSDLPVTGGCPYNTAVGCRQWGQQYGQSMASIHAGAVPSDIAPPSLWAGYGSVSVQATWVPTDLTSDTSAHWEFSSFSGGSLFWLNTESQIQLTPNPFTPFVKNGSAANNQSSGCMNVNGSYVCRSTIDNKYNQMEKGKDNYRDFNPFCSTHATIDQTTGQMESHIDLANPTVPFPVYSPVNLSGASIPVHFMVDAVPDAIYRATGMYLIPAGRTACQ